MPQLDRCVRKEPIAVVNNFVHNRKIISNFVKTKFFINKSKSYPMANKREVGGGGRHSPSFYTLPHLWIVNLIP